MSDQQTGAASPSGHEALVQRVLLAFEAAFKNGDWDTPTKLLWDALSAASPVPCAACAEKDAEIADLMRELESTAELACQQGRDCLKAEARIRELEDERR